MSLVLDLLAYAALSLWAALSLLSIGYWAYRANVPGRASWAPGPLRSRSWIPAPTQPGRSPSSAG